MRRATPGSSISKCDSDILECSTEGLLQGVLWGHTILLLSVPCHLRRVVSVGRCSCHSPNLPHFGGPKRHPGPHLGYDTRALLAIRSRTYRQRRAGSTINLVEYARLGRNLISERTTITRRRRTKFTFQTSKNYVRPYQTFGTNEKPQNAHVAKLLGSRTGPIEVNRWSRQRSPSSTTLNAIGRRRCGSLEGKVTSKGKERAHEHGGGKSEESQRLTITIFVSKAAKRIHSKECQGTGNNKYYLDCVHTTNIISSVVVSQHHLDRIDETSSPIERLSPTAHAAPKPERPRTHDRRSERR